jgi:hypothetical protein
MGRSVYIPKRLHFLDGRNITSEPINASPAATCLLTRSTDGYLRQKALRIVLELQDVWVIPFVVLLIGDYVVEIVDEILPALPKFNRDAYSEFVRENRSAMRVVRSKATSYWHAYYRHLYPNRKSYPGLEALHQLETWAS